MEEHGMERMACGCMRHQGPQGEHPDRFAMMMCMAKGAKMELLKEKLKKRIDATQGKSLDRVADVLAEMLAEKHKAKAGMMKRRMELKHKLEEIMMGE
jgi:hypothetical protein